MKPSLDDSWVRAEIRALRDERTDDEALARTISRVRESCSASEGHRAESAAWRAIPLALGLGGAALLALVLAQPANAASLDGIARAVRQQRSRHCRTYRPDARGALTLAVEQWVEDRRSAETFFDPDGTRTRVGDDGRRTYVVNMAHESFVDDSDPLETPVEDLDSYLSIPGAKVVDLRREAGRDVYTVDCTTVRFTLDVDPSTRLPTRRDVLGRKGGLIERNEYDYPGHLSAGVFRAPSGPGIVDYPALRRELAARLGSGGQTQTVGGVAISLKAVIAGRSRLLALWTGGGPGGGGEGVRVEGLPRPLRWEPPHGPDFNSTTELPIGDGQAVRGSGAWYARLSLEGPFTVSLPVRSGGRLVGRARFRVADALRAPDPDRVIFRPAGGASPVLP